MTELSGLTIFQELMLRTVPNMRMFLTCFLFANNYLLDIVFEELQFHSLLNKYF